MKLSKMQASREMTSNFEFLKLNVDEELQELFPLAEEVEKSYVNGMYSTVFRSMRPALEHAARLIADQHFIKLSQMSTFNDVLRQLDKKRVVPNDVLDIFHELKNQGNTASHDALAQFSRSQALKSLHQLYGTLVWLVQTEYNQKVVANFKEPVAERQYQTMAERKLVYVQTANNESGMFPAYDGFEKIGEASTPADDLEADWTPNSDFLRSVADRRLDAYMKTSGVPYVLHWAELAYIKETREWFHDYDVHKVLQRSNYRKSDLLTGSEWYKVDVETAKKAIKAVKEGRQAIDGPVEDAQITLRPEQEAAVALTRKIFKKPDKMLWNAKMRFGKTITTLELIKQEQFQRVLIMTHRPVVSDSWFEDFGKMQMTDAGYQYGSKNKGEQLNYLVESTNTFIYFASIQDLRGSSAAGGKQGDKNELLFDTDWDLVIIDEAHEGTQTELARNVLSLVTTSETRTLELSGTPFNLIDEYDEDHVYTWDYVMEQEAKAKWAAERPNEKNPYEKLPKVSMYTFAMRNSSYVDERKAFNFKEFFRTEEDGSFAHEKDVSGFLDEVTKEDSFTKFPYSTQAFRDELRHTLWLVPGVKEAKALTELMQRHPVFGKEYSIINIVDSDTKADIDSAETADRGQSDVDRVRKVIGKTPSQTKTITISVRRLTTGVNVPEWTAVMFLNNTSSAMQYLQAAFRAQTPYSDETGMKQNSYIFDFAPDRALTVMAESTSLSTGAGKLVSSEQRVQMGKLLNFLPIIGNQGNGMQSYQVDKLLTQIKRVYAEKAVRSGFDDDSLYSDELLKLDEADVTEFKNLQTIVGSTKQEKIDNKVDVNNQGLTDEEYEEAIAGRKKSKKKRTDEEQAAIDKMNALKKQKKSMVSILRGISIRIPMMIYGMKTDITDDITIEKFVKLVDEQSWEEFMPKGITKGMFNKFKKYYDPEVFIEAGRIIRQKVKELDELTPIERAEELAVIFGSFKNPDKETVLTPWRVVNRHMASTLGGLSFYDDNFEFTQVGNVPQTHWVQTAETAQVFQPDTKILEINSKTGLYPLYAAASLYWQAFEQLNTAQAGKFTAEDEEALWQKILAENIYVVAKTPMAKTITERTLAGYKGYQTNVQFVDGIVAAAKNSIDDGVKQVKEAFNNMKFDVVIGNPPYQEDTVDNGRDAPIYHLFYDLAFKLADKVTLITPGRFLFNAGQTPKVWNYKMLNDNHFKVVYYSQKSGDVFPNTDIKGGVAVTLRDVNQEFEPIKTFTAYEELNAIVHKVWRNDQVSLSELISTTISYKLSDKIYEENPQVSEILSSHNGNAIRTNAFDLLPFIFTDEKPKDGLDYIQIFGRQSKERVYKWIRREYVQSHINLDKYKIFVPEANGTGALGEVLSTPVIGVPVIGHNQSFISIGSFDTEQEALATLKYVKSKFARTMLGVLKITQHNGTPGTWKFVPLQDFTANSDIDWTKSIPEIDAQLYAKYQLTDAEIAFIEAKVTAMK